MMDLLIRPARPEDREAVLAFTSDTWGEHGDYIHMVWEDWLSGARGPLLVGLLDGAPVSLVKVTWNNPGEAWMEGMRVHPERRGQDIGTQTFFRALEWTAANGGHIGGGAPCSGFSRVRWRNGNDGGRQDSRTAGAAGGSRPGPGLLWAHL